MLMSKEYIRTTENFSNETREWTFRGDRGQEKFEEWNEPGLQWSLCTRPVEPKKWSLGVHALSRDHWMDMSWIIAKTCKMFYGDAAGNLREFEYWVKSTPNWREIMQKDIEEELEDLIKLDMVRVREKP